MYPSANAEQGLTLPPTDVGKELRTHRCLSHDVHDAMQSYRTGRTEPIRPNELNTLTTCNTFRVRPKTHRIEEQMQGGRKEKQTNSDTGNRTPSCRVKGGNVSRYTISDSGSNQNRPLLWVQGIFGCESVIDGFYRKGRGLAQRIDRESPGSVAFGRIHVKAERE